MSCLITELTFLANELFYRDFINIVGKLSKVSKKSTKNSKIFVSFVAHDFPVINYYQNCSLLYSVIGKQCQFALATGIHYPAKPARWQSVSPIMSQSILWLLKVAQGPGIRQRPGFGGKWKWNFQKIAWIKFLQVKTKKTSWIFDFFQGLCVFSMDFFLVYGSILWFCYHTYLMKNLRSCPCLVYIWRFHWVMVIHTYFCTKGYDLKFILCNNLCKN